MKNLERDKISYFSGLSGLALNLILSAVKIFLGIFSASVSVFCDGLNNLSDAATNIVSIVGIKLAQKPVDKEHPFGHGRYEYVSALIISFLIFLMAVELAKSSIGKIINPGEIKFSFVTLFILILAIFVKALMALVNHVAYKKTGNINLKAVKKDSLSDVISTSATVAALLISTFTNFKRADGIFGIFVCLMIVKSGLDLVKEVIDSILGKAPSKKLVEEIYQIILKEKIILGLHDLIVHDYGPRLILASAHAEVPDSLDIKKIHQSLDHAEKEVLKKLNVNITLHADPVSVDDKQYLDYKEITSKIISAYNKNFDFHDFKILRHKNEKLTFVFDLVIPFEKKEYDLEKIRSDLKNLFKKENPKFHLDINIEHSYV